MDPAARTAPTEDDDRGQTRARARGRAPALAHPHPPTMAHIYDVGTRAWQPDTAEGWVASEVTDKQVSGDKVSLVFTLENGEVRAPLCLQHFPGS